MANDESGAGGADSEADWRRRIFSLQYLDMIEGSGEVGFWSFDLEKGDLSASPGFHRIHGSTPQTFAKAMDFVTFVHPDDIPKLARHHEVIVSGTSAVTQCRIVRPDGSLRWIALTNNVILGPECRPVRVIGIVTDLTKGRDAVTTRLQSEERYDALVALVSEVVWSISSLGLMVECAGWEALTGQSRASASHDGWLDAVDPDDRPRIARLWRQAQQGPQIFATDFGLRCRDMTLRRFDARLVPQMNPDGGLREWIGILTPIAPADPVPPAGPGVQPALSAAEIRGARGLLNWSIPDLAKAAGVSISTVKRLEDSALDTARGSKTGFVRKALEHGGVDFLLLPDGRSAQALRPSPPAGAP